MRIKNSAEKLLRKWRKFFKLIKKDLGSFIDWVVDTALGKKQKIYVLDNDYPPATYRDRYNRVWNIQLGEVEVSRPRGLSVFSYESYILSIRDKRPLNFSEVVLECKEFRKARTTIEAWIEVADYKKTLELREVIKNKDLESLLKLATKKEGV